MQDWRHCLSLGKRKQKLVAQAKRQCFRNAVHKAAEDGGIWRLAKWGRTKAQRPNELPIMPALVTQSTIAHTITEKAEVLQARFYPNVEADLSDIQDTSFSRESFPLESIQINQEATREEVEAILKRRKPFTALGKDGISNGFLKAIGHRLAEAIATLATAC